MSELEQVQRKEWTQLLEAQRREWERDVFWVVLGSGLAYGVAGTLLTWASEGIPVTRRNVGEACVGIITGLILLYVFLWLVFRIQGRLRTRKSER